MAINLNGLTLHLSPAGRLAARAAEDRGHVGESHADAESYEMSRFRFRIASAVVDPPERNDASWSYL